MSTFEQDGIRRTIFDIPKMDCPSEERMIRMALEDLSGVLKLVFDLQTRKLKVLHKGAPEALLEKLSPLKLGANLTETGPLSETEKETELASSARDAGEAKVLKQLLGVNATMFVVEIVIGLLAQSTGLIADSLDMLADATVYGLSLYAVGKAPELKLRSARLTGYLQLLLALGSLFEVARRAFYGSEPQGGVMVVVSAVALAANVFCLALLMKHRTGGIHMRATYICSSTDVIANAGVLIAGLLVMAMGSPLPDLVIGAVITVVVAGGGVRILRVARSPQ